MENYIKISLILFLAILIVIGTLSSRTVTTENQYLLAGRKTKLFALVATLVMTEFNTATLIAFSAAGYYARWWAISLPCVFLIGLLFYASTVAKKWKMFNGISVAAYFSQRYGRDVGILAAVILFTAMTGFSATYVKALTFIFMPLLPHLNQWLLSGSLISAVLLVTWRSGLISIIKIDMISFIIMLLFFPTLLFFTWHYPGSTSSINHINLQQMQTALPPKFVFSLIFLTMFSYILAPWYGQKVISAETSDTAIKAVAIAAVMIFFLYTIGVSITSLLATKGVILAQPEQALPYAIKTVLPVYFQGIGYTVLFLTAATTLSGIWSAMVTLIVGENPVASSTKRLRDSLWCMSLCAFLSFLLANLFVDKIFNKMILANIPVVALSFTLLAGFYWKISNRFGVYLSIIVGLVWGIGCYFIIGEKNIYTWYWAVYGIPLIFISGIFGTFIAKKLNSSR